MSTETKEDITPTDEKKIHLVSTDEEAKAAKEVLEQLKKLKRQQLAWDPNLPDEVDNELDEAFDTDDYKERMHIAEELLENSGHSNTIRAWFFGMIFATLGSACNALLSMRNPYIVINTYVVQIIVFPMGVAWAKWLPEGRFRLFGRELMLNPGPFSQKEHALIVIMANACFGGGAAYALEVIIAQRAFYNQHFGYAFEICLAMSNMMLGFGMAGFFNRFLVQPAAMIWPGNLVNTALFTALHDRPIPDPAKTSGWKINRYRFFTYVMIGSFVWFWFPGYMAPFLSYFAWVTWIAPQNVVVNQLFGQATGLSFIPLTFDWTQISGFNFSPLIAPWHAIGNTLIGLVIFIWILTPAMHYSNYAWSDYLPISDPNTYDNTGQIYNVSRIIDPVTFVFDEEKYKAYSPVFLSTTFTLCYGLSFAAISSVLTHTVIYNGKDIWRMLKKFNEIEDDIHSRLMAKYKPVPLSWYMAVFIATFAMAMGITVGFKTHLAAWALILGIFVGFVFFLPIGLIAGTTNIWIGLNVLCEFMIGYMQPGRPLAGMMFKAYGYMALYQGLGFANDMKLGHYIKIPPRVTFTGQMVATAWSAIVQVGMMNWALGNIENICHRDQKDHFSCPNARVFFNSSVIWNLISGRRVFSPGATYSHVLIFFLPGFILPIVFWLIAKKWPKSPAKYLCAPIIYGSLSLIPPATPMNYATWGLVGFIFNKWIKNRWRGWWMQYNYTLSAGLDVGLALSTIFIFCTLQLTKTNFPTWWGNGKAQQTMDLTNTAIRKHVAEGEYFGPRTWS
ncbi:small oligopeptide transporter [Meira miltonrushii]|uniref:Small oligopeptide transporter n=1 Tax=Meira miltonrushii TaxID=1280837 RepID=A0A316V6B7_9BASI|nr:small oligopeptide transporter [Meira miltonrushii]PWN33139.1 small oligopeptide transporter [Meira miltonrushii]